MAHKEHHPLPLWTLFLVLLSLTVAEVGLFEIWSRNQAMMPKYAMVLLLLIFTLPKAAIVLIYFMHLKFEKHLVITLALIPFMLAAIVVLPILTDIMTLKSQSNVIAPELRQYNPVGHGEMHSEIENGHVEDTDGEEY